MTLTQNAAAGTVAALVIVAVTAGCSPETIEGVSKDTQRNAKAVGRELREAERKARPEVAKLNTGARVTAALKANENLPNTIRVDADADSVRLKGTVKTAEQKRLAERIARDTLGPEKTVKNELQVEGA